MVLSPEGAELPLNCLHRNKSCKVRDSETSQLSPAANKTPDTSAFLTKAPAALEHSPLVPTALTQQPHPGDANPAGCSNEWK